MVSSTAWNWLVSVQVLLISAGVVSIATALKFSVIPLISELSSSYLPPLRTSIVAWLKPPFLFLIINGIIITIAASYRFQYQSSREVSPQPIPDPPERVVEVRQVTVVASGGDMHEVYEDKRVVAEESNKDNCLAIEGGASDRYDEAEVLVDSRSPVVEMYSTEVVRPATHSLAKKPKPSPRFFHRKSLSGISGGGRAPRAGDFERHETMEATWKAITEGRVTTPTTVMRHLSRSGSWDDREGPQISPLELGPPPPPPSAAAPPTVKKSETFKDRSNRLQLPPLSPVKLRKEPSLSPEELNRRVEAFIEKFNEEMRLQRQASLEQLKETMGRGL
ncbi:uncharacterized protein LOC116206949 [Punica granatum]|uniref:DUF4408 domain-containing protein n=2 Tax=Punica granatum TaxID=22663 RepID=A0A218WYA1_PUNGR|nr:uncharacterized protein LOC116206949 [Punica granatum]OWM77526.1 hypothetical protein CDL15_Pgr016924 [Punica granatum]PKI74739.1 hypothetical protein CRG98_004848 [Punica granatum]